MAMQGSGLAQLAVRRPLLIMVMNLLIVIAGLASLLDLDIRELPDVDRPIVSVRAALPGGAPETMDAEVTSVLESAIARVSGVREIVSSSEENSSRIRVEFQPGIDLDTAASDVREAVSRVTRDLPDRVENVFVTKADDDADPIITIAFVSDVYAEDELTRIIETDIAPEILSVEGVAAVQEFGTRLRQMRVVIDPLRLNRFGLTVSDVATALRTAPFDVPVGSFRSEDQELIVRAEATAATPDLIKEVIIRGNTRIGDVAEVTLAPADATNLLRLNGVPVIGLGVVRQAQSNTIEISDAVAAKVKELDQRIRDVDIRITSDEAVFIRTSVREVVTSLLITIVIVVGTIWVFLGSWKATLVPALTIPIALIGTLAGIWLLGFSINLLTLLALVLATGLIVDDAIVVLENVQRQQANGMKRRAAAAVGTQQVFFAVIATTAVLVAVFVPISFLPSFTGRLFREFGFVLAFAVIISSFVAVTLAPAIAAQFSFRSSKRDHSALARLGGTFQTAYCRALNVCLSAPLITVVVCLLAAGGAALAYQSLDRELVPPEDRGRVEVFATGPDGVGLTYMDRQADAMEAILAPYTERGDIDAVFTIVGRYDPNRVGITATLAPWDERDFSQQELIATLRGPMSAIPGARVSVFGRGTLDSGGGNRAGLQVALTGSDYPTIFAAAREIATAIDTQSDVLTNAEISYQPTQPQLSIRVDRRRANDLNVPLDEIELTLRAMVGGEDVVDLNVRDEAIPILLESANSAVRSPADLSNLLVRAESGMLIPISSMTEFVEEGVAAELDRVAQRRAIEIEMDINTGYALADAIAEINRITSEKLPNDIGMLLQGEAANLEDSSRDVILTYAFALVIVFLVLVAQFESFSSPIVVMLIVPFGLAAAIYALFLTGISLNIYSQIGLILLIGLMAKNGILLVEFADQLRAKGNTVRDAVFEAAKIRVRPILMTVISTALGVVPLILSGGAGSEARQAIGWVVFGGLGLAGLFTLFLTPVLYLAIAGLSPNRNKAGEAIDKELREAGDRGAME
ncbi:MAG: efflux RND transporter permease subunit [Alphaproteobacteria bacterium]|nr:efflux RND transporter permease subunit [Alphaproteobacteria bacterium]MBU2083520.1 efflux RND transporter permease subunit [Alphaproteobacteria bacterium]MBU2143514.1 efflux RND transporter permease subunit [Alphaproteobacteria bacterium]MBU2196085.1 efflux RND transporter permease subunit [Alphaproteobacteria bacterium]